MRKEIISKLENYIKFIELIADADDLGFQNETKEVKEIIKKLEKECNADE